MTQGFKQIVFCSDDSAMNTNDVTRQNLISGTIFRTLDIGPLSQLGVQAPPGTKFYINDGVDPVIVGFSGFFDIDLGDGGSILSLKFDKESIDKIASNDSAILIIDMAYWLGG